MSYGIVIVLAIAILLAFATFVLAVVLAITLAITLAVVNDLLLLQAPLAIALSLSLVWPGHLGMRKERWRGGDCGGDGAVVRWFEEVRQRGKKEVDDLGKVLA